MLTSLVLTCLAAGWPQTQDDDRAALARFEALPILRQVMVTRRAEQRLAAESDPSLRRILDLRVDEAALPPPPQAVHFDPVEWTQGVAPARYIIAETDPRHRAVSAAMPAVVVLPDLSRSVHYDWRTGTIVKSKEGSTWRDRFANLLRGYPPNADAAYARVLAALDVDVKQRKLADYFEHTYADRNAGVYAGVTLYQAWYAGETIEMPDVDAIAYAVRILGDTSYHAPIPADARRDRLYAKIQASALSYRKYRTMLEAAAAAFVCAEPEMDEMYARLAPRFHYLFKTSGDDLDRARHTLAQLGSRQALIDWVDAAVVGDETAMERRESRGEELAAMAKKVRAAALRALDEETAAPATNGKSGR